MPLLALIVAGFAIPVVAGQGTDYPHRDWGQVAALDMTSIEASACVTRLLSRIYARVTPIPAEGGTDIEGGPGGGLFGTAHEPWVSYQIRTVADQTTLRVFYRHPANQRAISRDVRRMSEKCLKVKKIEPAVPASRG